MNTNYTFTREIPHNSQKAKYAFISLFCTLILCIAGVILSKYFWEGHTSWVYSLKYQRNIEVGWPVTLHTWSLWLGIAIIVFAPMIYFMQDWKNPSLALHADGLFINQQGMRNTFIPYKNIKALVKEGSSFNILLLNSAEIVQQQVFFFKPFIKSNLAQNTINISEIYSNGNLDEFMSELEKKINHP